MTNVSLAQSYLIKARKRLKILPVLLDEASYSDVVREAQEIVELALKGMLRQVGIEPPKWHDVGPLLKEYRARFAEPARRSSNAWRIFRVGSGKNANSLSMVMWMLFPPKRTRAPMRCAPSQMLSSSYQLPKR